MTQHKYHTLGSIQNLSSWRMFFSAEKVTSEQTFAITESSRVAFATEKDEEISLKKQHYLLKQRLDLVFVFCYVQSHLEFMCVLVICLVNLLAVSKLCSH